MLIRLVHLLPEVSEFLKIQHKQELKAKIFDIMFQIKLAFSEDMFSHFNGLNLTLQRVGVNILGLRDKFADIFAKLELWKTKMQSRQIVASFPIMNKMSETSDSKRIIQSEAIEQLNGLIKKFYRYFTDVEYDTLLVTLTWNPFTFG